MEEVPRCFYVGKGRSRRPYTDRQRNHKWRAVVKRFGLRVEVCLGPTSNDEACAWEVLTIEQEGTFSIVHAHDSTDIGCNFTRGGDTGAVGWRPTEETLARMRAAQVGKLGRPHTAEAKQRIGEASKGRLHSLSAREKIRLAASTISTETRMLRALAAQKFGNSVVEELVLMRDAGWTFRSIGAHFGMSRNWASVLCKGRLH